MTQQIENINEYTKTRIEDLAKRAGLSVETLNAEFDKYMKEKWVIDQVSDEDGRKKYIIALLYAQYQSRPKVDEYTVIPIGVNSRHTTSKGDRTAITALVKGATINEPVLKQILFWGKHSGVHKLIQWGKIYEGVKLGTYQTGAMTGDDRAKFENPKDLQDELGILKRVGATEVTIRDMIENPSKKLASGYTDETDLRILNAVISRGAEGTRKDSDTPWANYVVTDETVGMEDEVRPDGTLVPSNLTIWIDQIYAGLPELALCQFIGTVRIPEQGQNAGLAQMDAIRVKQIGTGPPETIDGEDDF